jgi:MYXO-CTERM domain-containing protein
VGAVYTEAELKIVKQLFDQRRQFGASKQAALDQASAALARLDVAAACGILGCAAPVHPGTGGADGSMMGTGGRTGVGGSSDAGGAVVMGTGGRAGAGGAGGSAQPPRGTGGGQDAGGSHVDNGLGGCAISGADPAASLAFLIAAALAMVGVHRRRRR